MCRFHWLLIGALVLARVAPAQDLPTKEEMERRKAQLEELKRMNEELQRAAVAEVVHNEALLVRLSDAQDWPRPEPTYASAQDWRAALVAATPAAPASLLAGIREVRLKLSWDQRSRAAYADEHDFAKACVSALHAAGLNARQKSEAKVELGVGFEPSGDGTSWLLVAQARLCLSARVLRGEEIAHCALRLGEGIDLSRANDVDRAQIDAALERALIGLTAQLRQNQTAPAAASAWPDWCGNAARGDELWSRFRGSFRDEDGLDAGLAGWRQLERIELVPVVNAASGEPRLDLPGEELTENVRFALTEAGFALAQPRAPTLLQSAALVSASGPGAGTSWFLSVQQSCIEPEALIWWAGSWRIVRGASFASASFAALDGLDPNDHAALRARVAELRRTAALRAVAELLALRPSSAIPAVPPHPDGPAVANFLRTRALCEVPAHVLEDISNRIAAGLAPYRRADWIQIVDGEPHYDLPAVGNARSGSASPAGVRRALDAVIDEVSVADPLALMPFYDIWMHDRGYARPVLVPSLAEQLRGRRPSGAGALRDAELQPAREFAYRAVRDLDPKPRASAYEHLQRIEAQLSNSRVMVCRYVPENKSAGYTVEFSFWYEQPPQQWSELVRDLPTDHPLRQVGPALREAPLSIEGARRSREPAPHDGGL